MAAALGPSRALLEEAAEWMIRQQYDGLDLTCHPAFKAWHARSADHAQAWRRAQTVLQQFEQIPQDVGAPVLRALRGQRRRRAVRLLAVALLCGTAGPLIWRHRPAGLLGPAYVTAKGERRQWTLADGSLLTLNTDTAVDVIHDEDRRRLVLHRGEILLRVQDEGASGRPFILASPQGQVRTVSGELALRCLPNGHDRLAVHRAQAELRPHQHPALWVEAGWQRDYSATWVSEATVSTAEEWLWEQGMLLIREQRLGDVIEMLARYRRGVLRCDPAVADHLVSGALSVDDTDAALRLLARQQGLTLRYRTPYWVTLGPI